MSRLDQEPGGTEFEQSLAALPPLGGTLDRNRLMFEAGRRSAARRGRSHWAWPAVAATLAAVVAGETFALTLTRRGASPVVEHVEPGREETVALASRDDRPRNNPIYLDYKETVAVAPREAPRDGEHVAPGREETVAPASRDDRQKIATAYFFQKETVAVAPREAPRDGARVTAAPTPNVVKTRPLRPAGGLTWGSPERQRSTDDRAATGTQLTLRRRVERYGLEGLPSLQPVVTASAEADAASAPDALESFRPYDLEKFMGAGGPS